MVNRRTGLVQGTSRVTWLFDVVNHLFLMVFAALCVMPIIHITAMSLSAGSAVAAGFVSLWPVRFTTRAYQVVLRVHKRIISGTCGMMQPSWKGLQDDDIRN
jgi:ABC-type glycerol-3-phosphate transport system permease component